MSNYWVGVLTGLACALIFYGISLAIVSDKMRNYESQLVELKAIVNQQNEWIEENKTVMQTYKFFNQSWQAIIDLQENKK